MESKKYKMEQINIENIEVKEGVFTLEDGKNLPYKNVYINFKVKDNPLVFRAKIDKVLKDYLIEMLSESDLVADSDNKSDFWS